MGSRGMGAIKRSLMSFVGLGSASDFCAHNLHCALCVVKQAEEGQQQVEEGAELQEVPAKGQAGAGQLKAAAAAPAGAAAVVPLDAIKED